MLTEKLLLKIAILASNQIQRFKITFFLYWQGSKYPFLYILNMAQFLREHSVRPPPHLKSAGCLFSPLGYVEALLREHNRCWVPRNIPQNYMKHSATSSACKLLRWRLTLISCKHTTNTIYGLENGKLVYLHCCLNDTKTWCTKLACIFCQA